MGCRLRVPGTSKDYSSTVQAADQQPLVTLLDTDERCVRRGAGVTVGHRLRPACGID